MTLRPSRCASLALHLQSPPHRRQNCGVNSTNTLSNSSRPSIIAIANTQVGSNDEPWRKRRWVADKGRH